MNLAGALGLGERELVAFVGAGGKQTAMSALAEAAGGRRVGYTTTTHMRPPEFPLVIARQQELRDRLADSPDAVAFAAERVESPSRATSKVRGYDPAVADALFEAGTFDWLLVKADGARRREFKAPPNTNRRFPRERRPWSSSRRRRFSATRSTNRWSTAPTGSRPSPGSTPETPSLPPRSRPFSRTTRAD
jgi:hypothetical protein